MRPIRREVERLLDAGQTCGVPKTEGTCRERLKRRQALWTFGRHPEVEPTNHAAERAIRPGVLWRTGSFGTQSAEGSRVVEAMMTAVATLNQQHRNVLDDLTTACEAALQGNPPPSLLPPLCDLAQLMRPAASFASVGERLLPRKGRGWTSVGAMRQKPLKMARREQVIIRLQDGLYQGLEALARH